MKDINEAMKALRIVESDGDYQQQAAVSVDGKTDRKLGAYGILQSKFGGFAKSMGYAGANWRDARMQDTMVKAKLQRDYEELGDWNLTVLAFRFGLNAARQLAERDYYRPADIEKAGQEGMGRYLRDIRDSVPKPDHPVQSSAATSQPTAQDPNLRRSEDILRKHMYGMRDRKRAEMKATPEPEEEVTE